VVGIVTDKVIAFCAGNGPEIATGTVVVVVDDVVVVTVVVVVVSELSETAEEEGAVRVSLFLKLQFDKTITMVMKKNVLKKVIRPLLNNDPPLALLAYRLVNDKPLAQLEKSFTKFGKKTDLFIEN